MAVNINVSPYFDDFNETKNFMRVLFKPGVAVQARELTQSQTILQNQIKKVGDYLFSDGDKVTGPKPSVNLDARTIRLKTSDSRNVPITLSNYLNTYVRAENSEVIGYVEFIYEADDPVVGDPPSLVITLKRFNTINDGMFDEETELYFYTDYTAALNLETPNYTAITVADITKNATSTTKQYSTTVILTNPSTIIEVGDLLVHPSLAKKVYVTQIVNPLELIISEAPDVTIGGENISYVKKAVCPTSILTQDSAVFYKYGFFVTSTIQKVVPDKNTAYPTRLIAFLSDQQVITSEDDPTLLDPALGSSNYFASGADRLKVDLNLSSLELNADFKPNVKEDLVPLLNFNKGEIEYLKELTNDSVLEQKLAERTFDESGSYVVDNFKITPVNGLESDATMTFKVSAGKAYVGGYPVVTVGPTEITVPKSATTETKTSYNINTTQSNYFKVSNVLYSLIPPQTFTASRNFLELHNTRKPTAANTRIGTIAFKSLEYDSSLGTDTQHKLYFEFYSPATEAPPTWSAWSTKYKIPADEGQYVANVLFTNNSLLGNFGPASTAYYGLFREPDTAGVAYWWNVWNNNGRDVAKLKETFALFVKGTSTTDAARILTNSKSYLEVINNSPFYDGFLDVTKIKSIVGVSNELTSQGTSATYSTPFFYSDISDPNGFESNGVTKIFDPNPAQRLVYPIGKDFVKTVQNIKTEYIKVITNAIFSSGVYSRTLSLPESFALGDGTIPASTARSHFTILVKSGATANIKLGAFNFERGSVVVAGSAATVTINVGDSGFNGLADISLRIQNDDTQIRTKARVKNAAKILNIKVADLAYSMGIADIIDYKGIFPITPSRYRGAWNSSNSYTYNDIVTYGELPYTALIPSSNVSVAYGNAWSAIQRENSGNFSLDIGQRDEIYDHGTVKYIGPTADLPGNVIITFDYFTHSGEGPLTVDSYPASLYGSIPTYTSVTDSNKFALRDCIDFRPRRKNDEDYQNFDTAVIPTSTVTTEVDVTYYLGRMDRIYVTNNLQNYASPYNKFYVETGVDSTNVGVIEEYSSDLTKLSIATLQIPPYCVSAFEVIIRYDDNKRYTMKDIGKIDKLTIKLDKAVKLHSVEIAQIKSIITNDNGESLLKSGILVETFASTDKADLASGYFTSVINKNQRTCYPGSDVYNVDLELLNDTDVAIFNDIITKKYVEEVFVAQLEANSLVNPNPGAVNDGRGRSKLSKQNSFSVNLLTTGGLLLAGYIAYQTYQALVLGSVVRAAAFNAVGGGFIAGGLVGGTGGVTFAEAAAVNGEGVLSVAWGAMKDLGYSIYNSLFGIDAASKVLAVPGAVATEASVTGAVTSLVNGGSYTVMELAPLAEGGGAIASSAQVVEVWGGVAAEAGIATTEIAAGSSAVAAVVVAGGEAALASGGFAEICLASDYAVAGSAVSGGAGILSSATTLFYEGAAAVEGAGVALGLELGSAGLLAFEIVAAVAIAYVAVEVVSWVDDTIFGGFFGDLFSDERMKENIKLETTLPNGLNLYSFEYKKEFKHIAGQGRWLGFMANEVEVLYPNAVKIMPNGYKAVNYNLVGI